MADEKKYKIKEAIEEIKSKRKEKFDATVELHINLRTDPKKQDEQIRFTTMLPHGTGKDIKVAVMASGKVKNADLELSEEDLKQIESNKIRPGIDFNVLIAEPRMMGKLAQVARILGPAGVMPNPKTGTVTEDVEKAVEQVKKGKVEIRTEQVHPIIHTIIGKVSFEEKQLIENYEEVMSALRSNKPQKANPDFIKSVFLSSSMGKSYQLEI